MYYNSFHNDKVNIFTIWFKNIIVLYPAYLYITYKQSFNMTKAQSKYEVLLQKSSLTITEKFFIRSYKVWIHKLLNKIIHIRVYILTQNKYQMILYFQYLSIKIQVLSQERENLLSVTALYLTHPITFCPIWIDTKYFVQKKI